jgi:hypothetical protein
MPLLALQCRNSAVVITRYIRPLSIRPQAPRTQGIESPGSGPRPQSRQELEGRDPPLRWTARDTRVPTKAVLATYHILLETGLATPVLGDSRTSSTLVEALPSIAVPPRLGSRSGSRQLGP